ncbi:hypothetical protein BH23GEM4_BH23GEM4_07390 [soil metagenome]
MAEPLDFQPIADPTFGAHDDLERLLETLHESGTLRLLDGLIGRLGAVGEIAVEQLDTPGGRQAVGNLLILGRLLTQLDAESTDRFANGLVEGVRAGSAALTQEPPSTVRLLRQLRQPEVRRGLHAALAFLAALGHHVHRELAAE